MRTRPSPTAALAAGLLAIALLGSGACSSEPTTSPPPTDPEGNHVGTDAVRDIGVDPADYITDYESPEMEDSSGSALSGGAPVPSTVPSGPGGGGEIGPYDDNTFVDPGHQGTVATSDDATATFGLDVDTGSYTVARQWISNGTRPDPASIRTEEWVNAFTYGYDAPEAPLGITVDAAPSAFADDRHVLRVGIQASTTTGQRRPANIVMVVDTSGSMDIADRLGAAKASLALLAQHLPDGDTIAIVTYADEARVILEPTPVEQTDTIIDAIDELTPAGSTNMEAGIREGYDLAAAAFRPDGINRVILASDGVANQGIVDPAALADFIQQQADDDIQLVTVGYGMGNLNDHLMEQLADRGDGMYAYIDRFEEAEELFGTRINSTIEPVALDAKAEVVFDPALVDEWRQIGYENRALTDEEFESDATDAGEVGAGHDVTALFEIGLAPGRDQEPAGDDERGIATAALRWEDPATGERLSTTTPVTVADLDASWDVAPPSLRAAATVATAAEVLAGAPEAAGRGTTLDAIVTELDDVAGEVGEPLSGELTELADLLRAAADLPAAPPGTTVPDGQ